MKTLIYLLILLTLPFSPKAETIPETDSFPFLDLGTGSDVLIGPWRLIIGDLVICRMTDSGIVVECEIVPDTIVPMPYLPPEKFDFMPYYWVSRRSSMSKLSGETAKSVGHKPHIDTIYIHDTVKVVAVNDGRIMYYGGQIVLLGPPDTVYVERCQCCCEGVKP